MPWAQTTTFGPDVGVGVVVVDGVEKVAAERCGEVSRSGSGREVGVVEEVVVDVDVSVEGGLKMTWVNNDNKDEKSPCLG